MAGDLLMIQGAKFDVTVMLSLSEAFTVCRPLSRVELN